MIRRIWNCIVDFSLIALLFIFAVITVGVAIATVCYISATAISEATRIHPIQMQTVHRYPPLVVKITKPDGEPLEATAVFEDASQTEKQQ